MQSKVLGVEMKEHVLSCQDINLNANWYYINPNLSFEQPVGLSGANPHETRKLGLLPQAKVPKSSGSEWSRRSEMSMFAMDIPTWMLI